MRALAAAGVLGVGHHADRSRRSARCSSAMIAVGTLTGFAGSNRASADERARNQATLLAAQDEERLRGLNVSRTRPARRQNAADARRKRHGTTFTITSSAEYVAAAQNKLTCETTGGAAELHPDHVEGHLAGAGAQRQVDRQSSIVDDPNRACSCSSRRTTRATKPSKGSRSRSPNRAETVTDAEETTPASRLCRLRRAARKGSRREASRGMRRQRSRGTKRSARQKKSRCPQPR